MRMETVVINNAWALRSSVQEDGRQGAKGILSTAPRNVHK